MIKVGIVGGTGYTGVELLRLLVLHQDVSLQVITSRSEAGRGVADLYSNLRGYTDLKFTQPDAKMLSSCDVVFFATPNGVAMQQTRALLDAGVRVIDLAADFRIKDVGVWSRWYGMKHASPDLVAEAVYGLPELNREAIRDARLVANPGCYPTAVTLGFLPMLQSGIASLDGLVADCKSGTSGAGRMANTAMLLAEAGESFKAYAVAGHRHQPEIRQNLELALGKQVQLTFVPHLLPMIRGIHATLYVRVSGEMDLQTLYENSYAAEPFVDVMPTGAHPETRSVRGGNSCRIAVHRPQDADMVVILSVIDNLVKGAAGQALQNMNLMFGLDEASALRQVGLLP